MVDFRYYLNRQGPRGQQGVKGEQGYSPQVTVGKNTASEFTLKVINEDGSFETENLKVVPENRGGTYVRYDKDTYQEYIGDPDIATTRTFGVVRLATKEDLGTQEESRAVTSALLDTYLQENYVTLDTDQQISGKKNFANGISLNSAIQFNVPTALIKGDKSGSDIILGAYDDRLMIGSQNTRPIKLNSDSITDYNGNNLLSYANVVAGDNIAIEKTNTGVKISSTGGSVPANMVTKDTRQTITGKKTINDLRISSQYKYITALEVEIKRDNGTLLMTPFIVDEVIHNAIIIGDYGYKLRLEGTPVVDRYNKKFLTQGSITAGSDNLAITETTDGVQITCDAPTNAQIENLQRLINDLSTKIDNLTPQKTDALSVANSGIENGKAASEDIQIKDGE